ncbi:MAG: hypothetical protein C0442_02525 [Chlorobiaceae bacterium]|nr:hypothetical protein [Chlorobiaceae bacterium]
MKQKENADKADAAQRGFRSAKISVPMKQKENADKADAAQRGFRSAIISGWKSASSAFQWISKRTRIKRMLRNADLDQRRSAFENRRHQRSNGLVRERG